MCLCASLDPPPPPSPASKIAVSWWWTEQYIVDNYIERTVRRLSQSLARSHTLKQLQREQATPSHLAPWCHLSYVHRRYYLNTPCIHCPPGHAVGVGRGRGRRRSGLSGRLRPGSGCEPSLALAICHAYLTPHTLRLIGALSPPNRSSECYQLICQSAKLS